MFVTIFLIFSGCLGMALSFARITDTRHQINLVRREIQEQKESNTSLRTEITQRYTLDEVAREAAERMGMNTPDPSQIVHINVPKVSHVVLNQSTGEHHDDINYFWQGIVDFFLQFL
jgi:cell division protein FtsL